MAIDGKYNVQLNTMMGPQSVLLILITEGESLSGSMDGHFGSQTFTGGTVQGDEIAWTVRLQSPIGMMSLSVTGTVDGDIIQGQVILGQFNPTPFTGNRV